MATVKPETSKLLVACLKRRAGMRCISQIEDFIFLVFRSKG